MIVIAGLMLLTTTNKDLPKDDYHDLILRELDCAVIEYMHQKIDEQIQRMSKLRDLANLNVLIRHEVYLPKADQPFQVPVYKAKITFRFVFGT